jgi:hypothetical protein
MARVHVFSVIYGGISRVKQHHSGVVGGVLGKEMGKDFWCRFSLNNSAHPASPRLMSLAKRRGKVIGFG